MHLQNPVLDFRLVEFLDFLSRHRETLFTGLQFLGLFVLLLASGFFSGSETALFSLSHLQARKLQLRHPREGKLVQLLLSDPRRVLISILAGNMFVNILATAMADSLSTRLLPPSYNQWVPIGLMTFLILIIGEITPKTIAARQSERISRLVAPLIWIEVKVIHPLQWVVKKVADAILRLFIPVAKARGVFSAEEFLTAVRIGQDEGVLDIDEGRMIASVVRLSSITVMELMQPRSEMAALPADSSYLQVLRLIQEKSYSRVPVYEESLDEIIGILYVKDFLQVRPENWGPDTLRGMLREPYYVPESKRARDLFLEFRHRRLHLAIVVDEYGGVSGLVTLDDLLEEIVGDIVKIGTDEPDFQPLGRGRALVKGKITLEHFNRAFQAALEDDEVVTLGGHLTRRLGRIPDQGERLELPEARFLVTSATPTHIEEMLVEFPLGEAWRVP